MARDYNGTVTKVTTSKGVRYKAIWILRDSTKKRITKQFDCQEDARNWLKEQKELTKKDDNNSFTLAKFYEEVYIPKQQKEVEEKNMQSSSFDRENQTYRTHIQNTEIGNTKLTQLTKLQIETFLENKLKTKTPNGNYYSYKTVYSHIGAFIKKMLLLAYKQEFLQVNLADKLEFPKNIKADVCDELKTISKKDFSTLYSTSLKLWNQKQEGRLNIAYLLACQTGLRRGEFLALNWSDIDLENRIIQINKTFCNSYDVETKNRKFQIKDYDSKPYKRVIGLNELSLKLLKEIKQRNDYFNIKSDLVFCNKEGNCYKDAKQLRKEVERLFSNAGIGKPKNLIQSSREFFAKEFSLVESNPFIVLSVLGCNSMKCIE